MGSPQQRISPSKESRSRQIRNPKTQENQDLPTAFLQNRILAHVKSQRRINRFRILHRRPPTEAAFGSPVPGAVPSDAGPLCNTEKFATSTSDLYKFHDTY